MKIFGLLLAFLASSAFGFMKANEYRQRDELLGGIIRLLQRIKNEISVNLTVQGMIYQSFADEALEACGFLPILRQESVLSPHSPLTFAIEKSKIFEADTQVREILEVFARDLGTMSRDEEIQRCTKVLGEFEAIYKARREESERQAKLYRSLGMSVGLGIVLILW